jgi:hypothetical protein
MSFLIISFWCNFISQIKAIIGLNKGARSRCKKIREKMILSIDDMIFSG